LNSNNKVYGKLSKNISIRLKITENRLSDLLDPSVTWIETPKDASDLVHIRNRLRAGNSISTNIAMKVDSLYEKFFAQNFVFSPASIDECLNGSLGRSNAYVLEVLSLFGPKVPGSHFPWLVDVHARALRAHLETVGKFTPEWQWVRALNFRSPFPVFGWGSRITHPEYLRLVEMYRSLRAQGYSPVQPIDAPDGWNPYWSKNEATDENEPEKQTTNTKT
jgi:hypothetical protein